MLLSRTNNSAFATMHFFFWPLLTYRPLL
jgi:hypothetical protein